MYNDFPTKNKKRAHRRYLNRKAQQHAIHVAKTKTTNMPDDYVDGFVERHRRNADNLKGCSCTICTENRKYHGPPIQELRHTVPIEEVYDSVQGTE